MMAHTRAAFGLVAIALLAATAGCGITDLGHDAVTVEIDSSDGSAVRVITSYDFVIGYDEDGREVFYLGDADTTWVEPFFSQDYDLNQTGRFYVRAAEAEDSAAVVSLRALVDGDETFFRETVLSGEGIQFYYRQAAPTAALSGSAAPLASALTPFRASTYFEPPSSSPEPLIRGRLE